MALQEAVSGDQATQLQLAALMRVQQLSLGQFMEKRHVFVAVGTGYLGRRLITCCSNAVISYLPGPGPGAEKKLPVD
jgi:hypothetical protein